MKRWGELPNRRQFLRGTGAVLLLPFFESLARDSAALERRAEPRRFALLFAPNGMLPSAWKMKKTSGDLEWSPTLTPLSRHKKDVIVFSGLWNAQSSDGDGHYAKVAPLLSCVKIRRTGGKDILCGRSIDQIAAQKIGHLTPLPSLELATEPVRTMEDMGYSTVYGSHVSWRSATEPAPNEISPRLVFDRLFRSAKLRDEKSAKSILDVVAGDARSLSARLSRGDRAKLDEFRESVRALEKRIDIATERAAPVVGAEKAPPDGVPADYQTHVRLMLDLAALAFETDAVRILTFMFGQEVSGRDFSFLDGVRGSHHDFSHHEQNVEKQKAYAIINRWHIEQYAQFLDRLKAIRVGEGHLLDHSMVVFSTAMFDGNAHDPHDLPCVLAGRGGGTISPGRMIAAEKDTPLANLWWPILDRLDVSLPRFADAGGKLPLGQFEPSPVKK